MHLHSPSMMKSSCEVRNSTHIMLKNNTSMQLKMMGLPEMLTVSDIAAAMHVSKATIYDMSKFSQAFYKVYTIPKKSGQMRTIAQPNYELKAVQGWILRNILEKLFVSQACKGFEKGTNIRDNAMPHVGANLILNLDLEDFFPSVKASWVCAIYKTIGYSPKVASILTSLVTFNGALPQGGPCSPKLANLACLKLDARIQGFVGKRRITYTRYADDLTFSSFSGENIIKAIPLIRKIIEEEKFKINEDKTRIAGMARRHEVTGLIITESYVGIGRVKYRELRAKIKNMYRANIIEDKTLMHLGGWLNFIKDVDNIRYNKLVEYIKELSLKHKNSALLSLLPK